MLSSFAEIPGEVRRRVRRGERVALIVLDAFGLEFLHRHETHPLVQQLAVTPLQTQFPSTTTAHVTTLHFGRPVHDHGLYEWNVLEPSLGTIICPLRFNLAGSDVDDGLAGCLDPSALVPGPTLYETLGAPALVLSPRRIERSTYTRLATRGATVMGFDALVEGMSLLRDRLTAADAPGYVFLYWDLIDRTGHERGPGSAAFASVARAALDALAAGLDGLAGVTILITADHGQVKVSPERVDYLDELWPELPSRLVHARPAGSSRDTFLHVRDGYTEEVIEQLSRRLGDRAQVRRPAELFGRIGPRLAARLGDVVVLPSSRRQVWLRSAAANERWFRGQHGGLEPAETDTYLAEVVG